MTVAEKAKQVVAEAKSSTDTFGQAIKKLNGICAKMPGSDTNAVYDAAMDYLFREMKNTPHGGAPECSSSTG